MPICQHCGQDVKEGTFCENCGARLTPEGTRAGPSAAPPSVTGAQVAASPPPQVPDSKKSNRTLYLIAGAVVIIVILAAIVIGPRILSLSQGGGSGLTPGIFRCEEGGVVSGYVQFHEDGTMTAYDAAGDKLMVPYQDPSGTIKREYVVYYVVSGKTLYIEIDKKPVFDEEHKAYTISDNGNTLIDPEGYKWFRTTFPGSSFSSSTTGSTVSMISSSSSTTTRSTMTSPATPVPASEGAPVVLIASGAAGQLTTVSLSKGITITYPSDWRKEETSGSDMRDFGRTTLNIATLYSPEITTERRAKDGPNPDTSPFTTLRIDVDPVPVTDFQNYFNLVTLALQKTYGTIIITKHDYRMVISQTGSNPGFESYRLDFDTNAGYRNSYIFTNADGTVYIFAFRNPSPYSSEVDEMTRSIVINPASA